MNAQTTVTAYLLADKPDSGLLSKPNAAEGKAVVIAAGPYTRLSYSVRRIDDTTVAPGTQPVVQFYGGLDVNSPKAFSTPETFTGQTAHKRGLDITDEAVVTAKVTTASSTAGNILEVTIYANDAQP